jgi:predicted permease
VALFLSTFLAVFVQVVLPTTVVILIGLLARAYLKVEAQGIARLSFYIMGPALAFSSLSRRTISGTEAATIATAIILLALMLWLIAEPLARAMRLDRPATDSFVMGVLFMNTGNYGLPVALLAFGQMGLDRAVVAFVAQAILVNTLGVFVASRSRHGWARGLLALLRVPMIYAALAGVGSSLLHVPVPPPLATAADILGQGAIPTLLLILGIQLAEGGTFEKPLAVATACFLRMVVSPALGFALAHALGLPPLGQAVVAVASGMPSAVNTIVMALEFRTDVRLSTAIVVVTTLISLVSVATILSLAKLYVLSP